MVMGWLAEVTRQNIYHRECLKEKPDRQDMCGKLQVCYAWAPENLRTSNLIRHRATTASRSATCETKRGRGQPSRLSSASLARAIAPPGAPGPRPWTRTITPGTLTPRRAALAVPLAAIVRDGVASATASIDGPCWQPTRPRHASAAGVVGRQRLLHAGCSARPAALSASPTLFASAAFSASAARWPAVAAIAWVTSRRWRVTMPFLPLVGVNIIWHPPPRRILRLVVQAPRLCRGRRCILLVGTKTR